MEENKDMATIAICKIDGEIYEVADVACDLKMAIQAATSISDAIATFNEEPEAVERSSESLLWILRQATASAEALDLKLTDLKCKIRVK